MIPSVPAELEVTCVHSLVKVFAQAALPASPLQQASAMANETFSFQVAYRGKHLVKGIGLQTESELSAAITIRHVGLVPAEMLNYHDHDRHVLRVEPGLYPDPLLPIDESDGLTALPSHWRSVWVTVNLNQRSAAPGVYPIRLRFVSADLQPLASAQLELEVLPCSLPEQSIVHTEWFHSDCLATHYKTDVFSERHWELIDHYVQHYAEHGINMLLTPLFTPPLDTAPGTERPTVQLVRVNVTGEDSYSFDFSLLDRWVSLCNRHGIRFLEFSHLFTQWGAKHAPKVMVYTDGIERQQFGWDTDSTGGPYIRFLEQLLPELVAFIQSRGLRERCYFHISDEPKLSHLPEYERASTLMREHLQGIPILDALSSSKFYLKGLVHTPVPPTDHAEAFLPLVNGERWTYYCCDQYKQVSNRFFCMPSARNRIIGMQLYKFKMDGFLHWGYNFWYSQFSRKALDPFRVTDADYGFPAGDAYLVYPGEDGYPVDSMRLKVLYEGFQDLRALSLLETLIGREKTISILEEDLTDPLTFIHYPKHDEWLITCRERINRAIQLAYSAESDM